MTLKPRALLALAATASLALSACGATESETAAGEGPRVLAAFYPLQWATEQVMSGTEGTVELLTKPGGDAHGLELSPRQIASLSQADLAIYLGDFQPQVDAAVEQSGIERSLNVADSITLLPLADDHGHDHDDADDHADDEDEDEDDHGDVDPHFWLDTERMAGVVEAIATELAELNPDEAADYRANAQTAAAELADLNTEFTEGLAACERREFITTHAAFGYLAHRYNMEEIGISGINPDSEASPARIAQVHEEAKRHGVTTIFFETLASDAVAKSIAGDLGLEAAVLDPLEGVTEASPGTDYPSIMRANLAALRSANECN